MQIKKFHRIYPCKPDFFVCLWPNQTFLNNEKISPRKRLTQLVPSSYTY